VEKPVSPVAVFMDQIPAMPVVEKPQVLELSMEERTSLERAWASHLNCYFPLGPKTKPATTRLRQLMKAFVIRHRASIQDLQARNIIKLKLIFEKYALTLFFADCRDVDKISDETKRQLSQYLNDRQMQPTDRLNLASIIGNRFLSLSDFLQTVKPTTTCCYEFLFLHEVIFEKLLCDREIQQRFQISMTDHDVHQTINITLRRICAMESCVRVDDVHYKNYLNPRKVISSYDKLICRKVPNFIYHSSASWRIRSSPYELHLKISIPATTRACSLQSLQQFRCIICMMIISGLGIPTSSALGTASHKIG
jgi:hypothetical protein